MPALCVWAQRACVRACVHGRERNRGGVGGDLLTKDEEDSRAGRLPSTLAGVCIVRTQHNLRDAAGAYHLENYDK